MKKGRGYVNRDGVRIALEDWKKLHDDKDYWQIRLYDNGVIRMSVEYSGLVDRITDTWPDMWKVVRLNVENYRDNGELAKDPVMHGKWFPNQTAAIAEYEQFLERWTASHKNEDGIFVEQDSIYEPPPPPPPPPSPDAPKSIMSNIKGLGDDDSVGAW